MTDGQKILSYLLVAMVIFLGWSNGGNSWRCESWKYCNMTVTFLFLKYLEIEDSLNLDILDVADPPVKKP